MGTNEEPTEVMAVRVPRYIANDIRRLKKEKNLSSLGSAITLLLQQSVNDQLDTRLNNLEEKIDKLQSEISLIDIFLAPVYAEWRGHDEWIRKGWQISQKLKDKELKNVEKLKELKNGLDSQGISSYALEQSIKSLEEVNQLKVETDQEKSKKKPKKGPGEHVK